MGCNVIEDVGFDREFGSEIPYTFELPFRDEVEPGKPGSPS
jgi:hypothetical protein